MSSTQAMANTTAIPRYVNQRRCAAKRHFARKRLISCRPSSHYRETDAGDGAYEAHVTKSDGTRVTVKFDSSLKVIAVEDGMGKGDPAPSGQQSGSTSTEG